MKGWQQEAGVGWKIFKNIQIILQRNALSTFESHASSIRAQTTTHAFSCLDAMTAEIFVLQPNKAIKN
jgi:hypothetical protein